MAFTINNGALYQLFDRPHMKIAIESCVGVVELWPLQTVQEMENDAKYTEDLQVRFSCTMARAMLRLSHGINPSVAEAVYEGMDEIPGCDPEIVQALTRANQAYDVMRNYSETNNADLFFEAADILGIFIDAHVETEVRNILQKIVKYIRQSVSLGFDGGALEDVNYCYAFTTTPRTLTGRFLAALAVGDGLMNLMCEGIDDVDEQTVRVLPVMLYINELCEQMAVPPIYVGDVTLSRMVALRNAVREAGRATPLEENSFCDNTFTITADNVIPCAGMEWDHHAECLRWDPKRAEQEAKDEDERKSKEALAEKFNLMTDAMKSMSYMDDSDDSGDSGEGADAA